MVGVNAEGFREILGIRIANSETQQGWLETFRWLKSRGLEGVDLMVSDAHEGLVDALHHGLDRILKAGDPGEARTELDALAVELEDDADRALETLESGTVNRFRPDMRP